MSIVSWVLTLEANLLTIQEVTSFFVFSPCIKKTPTTTMKENKHSKTTWLKRSFYLPETTLLLYVTKRPSVNQMWWDLKRRKILFYYDRCGTNNLGFSRRRTWILVFDIDDKLYFYWTKRKEFVPYRNTKQTKMNLKWNLEPEIWRLLYLRLWVSLFNIIWDG